MGQMAPEIQVFFNQAKQENYLIPVSSQAMDVEENEENLNDFNPTQRISIEMLLVDEWINTDSDISQKDVYDYFNNLQLQIVEKNNQKIKKLKKDLSEQKQAKLQKSNRISIFGNKFRSCSNNEDYQRDQDIINQVDYQVKNDQILQNLQEIKGTSNQIVGESFYLPVQKEYLYFVQYEQHKQSQF
ncbi:hypothetical protein PPERSA_02899 [Pseudocohnilembus persalinus]|uniref:Uncharacterized protein n=1 Tax=Pseudocohnilembus persalinus TaxID=266149 RepID=A0A0V0QNI4_PSEPJ|nr:hypothetical protein PPERSA_02899 [Pseudocohnilembus persalinus]|eukprot:KRX03520.1 hypothetical protein PPERSA_02899 [Pseudocohnilembus persalinus]